MRTEINASTPLATKHRQLLRPELQYFDTYCKICLCQNSTPTDLGFYELCRDNIEVVSDIDSIYENENETNEPSYSLTKYELYFECYSIDWNIIHPPLASMYLVVLRIQLWFVY